MGDNDKELLELDGPPMGFKAPMKLTKAQRELVRAKFGGRCAYCGEPLGDRWHADHLNPVWRKLKYAHGKGFISTNEMFRPQNDNIDNMMPACPSCNIDKSIFSIDQWRKKLQGAAGVLSRNNPTYRHAVRFGLIRETGAKVVFYFERQNGESGSATEIEREKK